MNALKNLSLILLLSLAFTGCHNKSSKINDFNLLLYACLLYTSDAADD